jgi:hypothetical protein
MPRQQVKPRFVVLAAISVLFLAAVCGAMWYNRGYDRYGSIAVEEPAVLIQVCTVDTGGKVTNALKYAGAEYTKQHTNVRIFVLPVSRLLINSQNPDVSIINENGTMYAFVSGAQAEHEIAHCREFLSMFLKRNVDIQITVK